MNGPRSKSGWVPPSRARVAPDTRLPSEADLAAQYRVARVTVRRAIALLGERGRVVTMHGPGRYVIRNAGVLRGRA